MPTNRGNFSYANLLEKRIITQTHVSYWARTQGKLTFGRMYEPHTDDQQYWNRPCIGYEMVAYQSRRARWQRDTVPDWIFRAFHDGTALYKPNKVRRYVRGWAACKSIDDVVYEHYYIDTQIDGDMWEDKLQVLRRKPLSSYARYAAQRENNLGDFLVRKYNIGGECEAVSR